MQEIVFEQKGTFGALYAAEAWCRDKGISYGSPCGPDPIGLMHGVFWIAKWRNLTPKEKRTLDGVITGDIRNGPITIKLYVPVKATTE